MSYCLVPNISIWGSEYVASLWICNMQICHKMQICHNMQTAAPHSWMVQAPPVQSFTIFPEAYIFSGPACPIFLLFSLKQPYTLRLGFPPLGKLKKPKIISSSKGPLFIETLDSFSRSPRAGWWGLPRCSPKTPPRVLQAARFPPEG